MKKKAAIGILLVCLFLPTAQAAFDATIEKDTISWIAGNTQTVNMTFESTEKTHIYLYSKIAPSPEGFNINFSDNNFTFSGEKNIVVTIKTATALSPDEYSIKILYEYYFIEDNQKTKEEKGNSGSGSPIIPPDKPEEQPDEGEQPIQQGSFTILGEYGTELGDGFNWIPVLEALFFGICLIVFALLIVINRNISKKEK